MYALLVALSTGEVRMYHDGVVVHSFMVEKPVVCLRFGAYGREDNSLVVVHGKNGALTVKILRRMADIDSKGAMAGPPAEQDIPLPVPKYASCLTTFHRCLILTPCLSRRVTIGCCMQEDETIC